jgi:hypothetical protein
MVAIDMFSPPHVFNLSERVYKSTQGHHSLILITCFISRTHDITLQPLAMGTNEVPKGVMSIKISLHDIFHIGPGINPRLPYQTRQKSSSFRIEAFYRIL